MTYFENLFYSVYNPRGTSRNIYKDDFEHLKNEFVEFSDNKL